METLEEKNQVLEARLAKAVTVFKEQKEKIESLQQEIEELKKSRLSVEEENSDTEIERLSNQLKEKDAIIEELNKKINLCNEALTDYEHTIGDNNKLKEGNEKLLAELEDAEKSIKVKDTQIDLLNNTITELRRNIELSNRELNNVKTQVEQIPQIKERVTTAIMKEFDIFA